MQTTTKQRAIVPETGTPFWSYETDEVIKKLHTQKEGLSDTEASERRKQFGLNSIRSEKKFSHLLLLLKQFKSPLIFILLIAGVATLVLGEFLDSGVIFLAITVNAFLGWYQESRAEGALERLKSYIRDRVRVVRNGVEHEIDAKELVVGDIIYLGYGARIPADARIFSLNDFSVDESILTGESLPVSKVTEVLGAATVLPDRKNMVFAGTLVVEGYAMAVVTGTGRNTEIGKIAELVATTTTVGTPLQQAVGKLAWIIALFSTVLIIGLFALGISRGEPAFEMFLVSIATAVGAIPEALPISLTAILSVGAEQLARRKGIMRNLAAAETLGSTTVIMTDKTGTLTQAKMQLVDILTANDLKEGASRNHHTVENLTEEQKDILRLAAYSTDVLIEGEAENPKEWKVVGRPLETHIVQAAAQHGINMLSAKAEGVYRSILPFSSVHKFSVSWVHDTTLSALTPPAKEFRVIVGAPDILLARSTMTKEAYMQATKELERHSAEGKRLLGVAIMEGDDTTPLPDEVRNSTFIGMLAFFDPVRPGVHAALSKIEKSGVRVLMATGDLKGTAMSVAKDIGWNVQPSEVLSGEELRRLSDEELLAMLPTIRIFARVTPEDKLRVGTLLRKQGEIVGMTGDGVNDAPALKAVNIGIAVGSGSDVAKDVADLVILDDNFETIVAAIEEGRRILGNVRKSFVYLMSNSLDEVILIGGSLIIGLPLPLTALQIIWVNFFTGSLPAVAFAFDDFLDQKYVHAHSSRKILDKRVIGLTAGIGTVISILLFILYYFLVHATNIPTNEARTFLFVCFASYILFGAFSLRSLRRSIFTYNPFGNKFLTFSSLFGILLIAATIYIPFLQTVFGTVALSVFWLPWIIVWILLNIAMIECFKLVYRK